MTSPSLSVSNGISWAQDFIRIGMPPIIVGQNSAHAIMSPLASASAQVKSRPSLKIVEYDVFISRIPISRQIDVMQESRMFMVTKSGLALRAGGGGGGWRSLSWGCTIGSLNGPVDVARRPAHCTHQSEQ